MRQITVDGPGVRTATHYFDFGLQGLRWISDNRVKASKQEQGENVIDPTYGSVTPGKRTSISNDRRDRNMLLGDRVALGGSVDSALGRAWRLACARTRLAVHHSGLRARSLFHHSVLCRHPCRADLARQERRHNLTIFA